MSIGDAIGVMEGGRIRQFGSPLAVYHEPADLFVARFVGLPQMNLVEGELRDGAFRSGPLVVPVGARGDVVDSTTLGVRPENLALTSDAVDGRTLGGRVVLVEPLGPETILEVEADVGVMTVRARGARTWSMRSPRIQTTSR